MSFTRATRIGGIPASTARSSRIGASLLSGLLAAVIGAVTMVGFLMLVMRFGLGADALLPVQAMGAYLYGDAALAYPSAGVVAGGLGLAFVSCAVWGIVFSIVASTARVDTSRWAPLGLGLAIGLVAHLVDINLLGPLLMNSRYGHDIWNENIPPVASWMSHLVFGMGFAFFVPAFRHLWLRLGGRRDLLV